MTISYPLALPSTAGARGASKIHITGQSVVGLGQSPFNLSTQVQVYQGQQWLADVTLPSLKAADAEPWLAFLLSLNGKQGTFLMGDPGRPTSRGAMGGSVPLVDTTNQAGQTLVTYGYDVSVTGVLKAGDWFHMVVNSNYRLHKLLKDVNSDSGGSATLDIWPALRESPPHDTALIFTNPTGQFRLSANASAWDEDPGTTYTVAFGAMEVI